MSIEMRDGIPVITPKTTEKELPPGGAAVYIEGKVSVIRGEDFADVSGRGIEFSSNGHSSKIAQNPYQRRSIGIDDMNA